VNQMVELSSLKRTDYEQQSPIFWRRAVDADVRQEQFFGRLVEEPDAICLVSSDDDDQLEGFVIGSLIKAPPVYDPGGRVCMIDDFVVRNPELWGNIGRDLKAEVESQAAAAGAVLSITVCGHKDGAKRDAVATGTQLVSEWYVRVLNEKPVN
jgi:hypothetical protein